MPTQFDLLWPTVEAIRRSRGGATRAEIADEVARSEGFTEKQRTAKRRPSGRLSVLDHELALARNGLIQAGYIEHRAGGKWDVTAAGREVADAAALVAAVKEWQAGLHRQNIIRDQQNIEDQRARRGEAQADVSLDAVCEAFLLSWERWTYEAAPGVRKRVPLDPDWQQEIESLSLAGLSTHEMTSLVGKAMSTRLPLGGIWRYFCGRAWAMLRRAR